MYIFIVYDLYTDSFSKLLFAVCTWLVRNLFALVKDVLPRCNLTRVDFVNPNWHVVHSDGHNDSRLFTQSVAFATSETEILKVFMSYLSPQNVSSFVSTACRPSLRSDNHLDDCFTTWWLPIFEKGSIFYIPLTAVVLFHYRQIFNRQVLSQKTGIGLTTGFGIVDFSPRKLLIDGRCWSHSLTPGSGNKGCNL